MLKLEAIYYLSICLSVYIYIILNLDTAHSSTPAGLDKFDSDVPRRRRSLPYLQDIGHSNVTGEVVTVTLEKGGSHLGLGLIDGLVGALSKELMLK